MTQPPNKPTPGARIHPEDRARIAALNTMTQALRGAPPEKPPTSYYTPLLIQCTLPHSDPKENIWIKKNGNYSLIVQSGADTEGQYFGIPYGSFPRLTLAYIITRVVETKERRIELSSHFGGFLKEIGYSEKTNRRGSNPQGRAIRSQLFRLLNARISFQAHRGDEMQGASAAKYIEIAPEHTLWWDYKNPDQGSLWGSFIELSEKFHQAILENPVPLRTDILAALKKSPLALDVYMWVSYRLFTLQAAGQEQVTLSYGALQEQFGTGISEANYRSFRRDFKNALAKVGQYWHSPDNGKKLLNYELHEDGFTLFRSPLLVAVPRRKIAEQQAESEAARILASKKFDDLTLKQARQIAGEKWDVKVLQEQYFGWIERKHITPKDPRAHFFNFIKRHRARNEKTA
jgi:hypothetical protein